MCSWARIEARLRVTTEPPRLPPINLARSSSSTYFPAALSEISMSRTRTGIIPIASRVRHFVRRGSPRTRQRVHLHRRQQPLLRRSATVAQPAASQAVAKSTSSSSSSDKGNAGVRQMFCPQHVDAVFLQFTRGWQRTRTPARRRVRSSGDWIFMRPIGFRRIVPESICVNRFRTNTKCSVRRSKVQVEGTRPEISTCRAGSVSLPWAVTIRLRHGASSCQ